MISRLAQLLLLGMSAAAVAQDHQPARLQPAPAVKVELVKTGLYLISGAGGNTTVRLSAGGIILVDGKLPGHYPDLLSGVHRIVDELPIRLLITTSQDEAHSGTNADFLANSIPILAQERVRENLAHAPAASAEVALPSTVFREERTIKLGGVTVEVHYFGPAHTGGDAVVYFPDLKVVAVGDLLTRETPQVDFSAGGSMVGWALVLERILQLDFDTVIPGSGPISDRAELGRFKSRLDAMLDRALGLVRKGVAKDQLLTELHAADPTWRLDFSGAPLDAFYRELVSAARHP